MLNLGCQPCSLYSEVFFCSSLKLFGSIRIAYGFIARLASDYNEKGVKGVSISKIKPNSLAEQRGLKSGDVIIGINRQKIENLGQLRKVLASKPSAVALNIIRGDSNFYLLVQ